MVAAQEMAAAMSSSKRRTLQSILGAGRAAKFASRRSAIVHGDRRLPGHGGWNESRAYNRRLGHEMIGIREALTESSLWGGWLEGRRESCDSNRRGEGEASEDGVVGWAEVQFVFGSKLQRTKLHR